MRPIKLEFYDHPFRCPICKSEIVYTSMQTVIVRSQRNCPSCQGALLIKQGAIISIRDRKPPKRENVGVKRERSRENKFS